MDGDGSIKFGLFHVHFFLTKFKSPKAQKPKLIDLSKTNCGLKEELFIASNV
jgi:hypothetical protein